MRRYKYPKDYQLRFQHRSRGVLQAIYYFSYLLLMFTVHTLELKRDIYVKLTLHLNITPVILIYCK